MAKRVRATRNENSVERVNQIIPFILFNVNHYWVKISAKGGILLKKKAFYDRLKRRKKR